jgi:hypothetical protein
MKILNGLLIIIITVTLAQSCNNTRRISSGRQKSEIHFGRTGGFTNIPEEYILNAKGNVLKMSGNESVKINDISGKKMKTIIKILDNIGFKHIEIYQPGNISYFIKVVTTEYQNSVTWNNLTPNDSLNYLFKELLTTIKP